MGFISIKNTSGIPKYRQIITSVELALENKLLKKGDQLPSINNIRNEFSLSRDTVLLAFNELKLRGIVESIAGKGYYVKSTNVRTKQKIFLLFDELNAFKENLYHTFITNLEQDVEVDIYFHHFNIKVFKNLIQNNARNYNHYIIMPANLEDAHYSISKLPKDKVVILDQTNPNLNNYTSIYQNFENDIYNSLKEVLSKISTYNKLVLVFRDEKQPKGMLNGFLNFCSEFNLNSEVIPRMRDRNVQKGDIYLVPDDRSLILAIKKIKSSSFTLGEDIGIISYNETLLKEIVADGITTISTDFNFMGKRLAEIITQKETVKIENPSSIIIRNSI